MRPIRFLLDGERIEAEVTEPTRTLLQYLREDLRRVGSKEGCAEGDCGACTVVIAELVDAGLQFRAVNACIQFLPRSRDFALDPATPGYRWLDLHPDGHIETAVERIAAVTGKVDMASNGY